jgi:hypothetical protein
MEEKPFITSVKKWSDLIDSSPRIFFLILDVYSHWRFLFQDRNYKLYPQIEWFFCHFLEDCNEKLLAILDKDMCFDDFSDYQNTTGFVLAAYGYLHDFLYNNKEVL